MRVIDIGKPFDDESYDALQPIVESSQGQPGSDQVRGFAFPFVRALEVEPARVRVCQAVEPDR